MSIATSIEIDAAGLYYKELNAQIRDAVSEGALKVVLKNVTGQRYIGTNLYGTVDRDTLRKLEIEIHGTPGNDLGMFLDGPTITVHGNVMDGSGNTMNHGRIVAHGRAGDITGFSARGGEMFIKGNAGYRVGIHMKEYGDMRPVMTIGGATQDFLGEYMAGGVVIILGLTLKPGEAHYCNHVGTGMHGGMIFLRGNIEPHQIGTGVGMPELTDKDAELLTNYIAEYGRLFDTDVSEIKLEDFTKLAPLSVRPYKQVYAY
ncbi:MAG: hypothetical protein ABFD54_06400 [Armatimonadota bacterium]|nr:hypothetical protein [bacterium]